MQPESKAPPSVETSAKFIAWNHKGIDEKLGSYLPQICGYLQSISRSLAILAKTPGSGNKMSDDIPF